MMEPTINNFSMTKSIATARLGSALNKHLKVRRCADDIPDDVMVELNNILNMALGTGYQCALDEMQRTTFEMMSVTTQWPHFDPQSKIGEEDEQN